MLKFLDIFPRKSKNSLKFQYVIVILLLVYLPVNVNEFFVVLIYAYVSEVLFPFFIKKYMLVYKHFFFRKTASSIFLRTCVVNC